ncbi:MAG: methyltransferase [Rugosibacter sp.]|nr:MAG: methyltransferase [Rugosibacter sp.]TBR12028.1 MAG: methyltransferase [Rugosibacter sp.]
MIQHNNASNADVPPPDAVLMQMLSGALLQQAICVVAKLGIADLLAAKPRTINELASTTKTHEASLYRVLRALAGAGIFAETARHTFELTPLATVLRSDVPNSICNFAILMGENWLWRNYGELMHSVTTGGPAQNHVHGMGSFEFFTQNAAASAVFNRAMTGLSQAVAPAIVESYDFSAVRKLVDIAGGHGLLLAEILKANPHMQGVLFDLPSVIEGAGALLEKEGVRSRVELASGDFFKSVPAGADAYVMKHIIHDWDDEHSIRILKNIGTAMNQGGKVLIIEMIVPEGNKPSPAKAMDLQMLIMESGKERTKEEYRRLLEAAGFRLTRIVPTKSPYSLIEGEC